MAILRDFFGNLKNSTNNSKKEVDISLLFCYHNICR